MSQSYFTELRTNQPHRASLEQQCQGQTPLKWEERTLRETRLNQRQLDKSIIPEEIWWHVWRTWHVWFSEQTFNHVSFKVSTGYNAKQEHQHHLSKPSVSTKDQTVNRAVNFRHSVSLYLDYTVRQSMLYLDLIYSFFSFAIFIQNNNTFLGEKGQAFDATGFRNFQDTLKMVVWLWNFDPTNNRPMRIHNSPW